MEIFKPRYRFRLNFEKDMTTGYLYFTPYIFGEYFLNLYDGGSSSNRFRLCVGSELKVSAHVNFEMYFLHPYDNGKSVDALNAAGFVLKFYIDHQTFKQRFSKKKQTSNE